MNILVFSVQTTVTFVAALLPSLLYQPGSNNHPLLGSALLMDHKQYMDLLNRHHYVNPNKANHQTFTKTIHFPHFERTKIPAQVCILITMCPRCQLMPDVPKMPAQVCIFNYVPKMPAQVCILNWSYC